MPISFWNVRFCFDGLNFLDRGNQKKKKPADLLINVMAESVRRVYQAYHRRRISWIRHPLLIQNVNK